MNVTGATQTFTEDFDDEPIGGQVDETWLDTEQVLGDFKVDNAQSYSGSNSFLIGYADATNDDKGWFNLTYSSTILVINISMLMYIDTTANDNYVYNYFYFKNSTGVDIVSLKSIRYGTLAIPSWELLFFGQDDIWHSLGMSNVNNWYNITFEFVDDDAVDYFFNGTNTLGTPATDEYLSNLSQRITDIYMYQDASATLNVHHTYIDNFNITVGQISDEGEEGASAIEGYGSIGGYSRYAIGNTWARYVETQVNRKLSGTIKAVDLVGDSDNFAFDGLTLAHLYLKVNGIEQGNPTVYVADGGSCIIRWFFDSPIVLTNEKILCEFYNSYMDWHVGMSHADLDNDGDTEFMIHDSSAYYDGFYTDIVGDFGDDLSCKIWCNVYQEPPDYEDKIFLDVEDGATVYTNTSVKVTTLLSTKITQSYVRIYKDDVLQDTIPINFYDYWFMHTPTETGIWDYNLTRGGVVLDSRYINVSAFTGNYLIYTYPNPQKIHSSFIVYYIYNNSLRNGSIDFIKDGETISTKYIPTHVGVEMQSFNYILEIEGKYIIRMYVIVSGTERELVYSYIHYASLTQYANQIVVDAESVLINNRVVISGSHNFLDATIYVDINNEWQYYVGDGNEFSIHFYPRKTGVYNCSLILYTLNGTFVLDYDIFVVEAEPSVDEDEELIWGIPTEYMYGMFGAFLTLGFLIIPFALSRTAKHDASGVVYAIFGGIGLGVSTLAGLFPLWLPLMITILVVTVLVIEYKKGR